MTEAHKTTTKPLGEAVTPDPVLPETPAGRETKWLLEILTRIRNQGFEGLTEDDFAPHWAPPPTPRPQMDPETRRQRWLNAANTLGGATIEQMEEPSPFEIILTLEADGKKWRNELRTEPEPPHRISWWNFLRLTTKEGLTTRFAVPEDALALSELDRSSPIVLGDTKLVYDRGDDWFAWTRLTENIMIIVAELDGEIVGVTCGAQHPVVIGGSEYLGNLGVHLRVSPMHQRAGIYPAMMQKFWESPPAPSQTAPVSYGYISRDNAAMQHAWRNMKFWSVPPVRGLLLCSDLAGAEVGRLAGPSDGSRIVEILNSSHEGEEFYKPHSLESLTSRLERAPDLYSWNNILLGEGSLVGVWPANLKVIRETNGSRSESIRALVLDHGFLPGYEHEFEELLRSWCSRLSAKGIDELSTFTSTPSPNYEVVSRLAANLEVFDLSTTNFPEPDGVSERGVYVDQIYF